MAVPRMIAAAKRLLDRNEVKFQSFNLSSPLSAFEANIDFEIRFMADTKVVGCKLDRVPGGQIQDSRWEKADPMSANSTRGVGYSFFGGLCKEVSLFGKFMSRCQMEVDIAWDDFISHAPDGDCRMWLHSGS
ncbi:hypothetical protein TCAL_15123 [Tigriopus californicus]|uniref:Uncharacterized protein n=1 Tax=Tigriopus californicus TaxID=6832 RepID=A0A553NTV1_TIGCA|nr:hypothetical protein TCAL_15123 [Tigriopus californicus]